MYWLAGILGFIATMELIARLPDEFVDQFMMTGFEPLAFGLPMIAIVDEEGPPKRPSVTDEIERIYAVEIPLLEELLPSESWHHEALCEADGLWTFDFECNFRAGRFAGRAQAATPMEAFLLTKQVVLQQIEDWHKMRFAPRSQEMDNAA